MSLRSKAIPRLMGRRGHASPRGRCVDCGETARGGGPRGWLTDGEMQSLGLALVASGEASFPECVRAAVGFAGGI